MPFATAWLTAAAVWLTGNADEAHRDIWTYRILSVVAGLAAALLTWWTALALTTPRAALIAGLLFPGAVTVATMARLAGSDAVQTALILLGIGALARIVTPREDSGGLLMPFLFWTALGVGTVIGGWPAPILFASLTIALAFVEGTGWIRRMAPLPGLIWLAVLLVPAALALWFGSSPIGDGLALPVVQGQTDLAAPPGTYLLTFLVLFWPGAAFVVMAVTHILDHARQRPVTFLLAWAMPYWLMIELWPGKLPQYALPVWPALAILAAMAIDADALKTRGVLAWIAKILLVLTPVGIGVYVSLGYMEDQGNYPVIIPILLGLAVVAGLLAAKWLDRSASALLAMASGTVAIMLLAFAVFGLVAPGLNRLKVAEKAIEVARKAVRCPDLQIGVVGFREPSILLAGGIDTKLLSPRQAVDFLSNGKCRVVLLDRRRQASFVQRAADIGMATEVRGSVRGYNPGVLADVTIHAVVQEGAPK